MGIDITIVNSTKHSQIRCSYNNMTGIALLQTMFPDYYWKGNTLEYDITEHIQKTIDLMERYLSKRPMPIVSDSMITKINNYYNTWGLQIGEPNEETRIQFIMQLFQFIIDLHKTNKPKVYISW